MSNIQCLLSTSATYSFFYVCLTSLQPLTNINPALFAFYLLFNLYPLSPKNVLFLLNVHLCSPPPYFLLFSTGFYSVSGSSLSDSCYSVASEAAPAGPLKIGGPCRPHSLDHSTTQWREDESQNGQNSRGAAQKGDRRPASTGRRRLFSCKIIFVL